MPAQADDDLIARISFEKALGWLDDLKTAALPLSHGAAAKFQSLVPTGPLDELYGERNAYWWGYAAVMQEFAARLSAAPRAAFVPKKRH